MDQRSAFTTVGGTATAGATRPWYGRPGTSTDARLTGAWLTPALTIKPVATTRMFVDVPNHRTRRPSGRASP